MINMMWAVVIFSIIVLPIALAIVAWGTIRKNKWGINLKKVYCPKCGEKIPSIRKPTSRQQATWGGVTCPKCGCEVDKWGREIEELNKKESGKE